MAPKTLPDFETLQRFYRGDGYTADQIKKLVGGSVNSPDIDDTCIVRISEPLNNVGHLIPVWTKPFRTRQGADKRWYGLRVSEFWPYMVKTYGPPTVSSKGVIRREDYAGIRGIIGFRVKFRDNSATGHFTLWDGEKLLYGGRDHDYFAIATEAALWEAGNLRRISAPM